MIAIRPTPPDHPTLVHLAGDALKAALPDVARLRIEVFRAFPYLYDGDLDYETEYLSTLITAQDAVVIAAFTNGEIVGCATGSAIVGRHDAFSEPLSAAGIDLPSTFYFGESVLQPALRGRGIGHAFFDLREAWAARLNYQRTCFCAVKRPSDHPLRPKAYRPLDAFWRKRGYEKLRGAFASFEWRDVDKSQSDRKPMQIWIRAFPTLKTPI